MDDPAIELYKLEYEKGAERYENIYKSVWANFNYLILLAGGILAFSSNFKVLPTWVTIVLAVLPLLYWYVAVFTPGNRYGDQVVARLSQVEDILNEKYARDLAMTLSSPPVFSPLTSNSLTAEDYGLKHFTRYHKRTRRRFALWVEGWEVGWPAVRVTTFWAMLGILAVAGAVGIFSILGGRDKGKVITVEQNPKALEVKVAGADAEQVQKELESLKALVGAMSEQLRRIEERQRQPPPQHSPQSSPQSSPQQSPPPTTQQNGNNANR